MKHILKYKLWGGKIPFFIEDGGYYTSDGYMIGVSRDDTNCYIPSDILKYSKNELKDYVRGLDIKDEKNKVMNDTDKDKQVDKFLSGRNLESGEFMNGDNVPNTVKEIGIYVHGKLELVEEKISNLEKKIENSNGWKKWAATTAVAIAAILIAYLK